MTDPRSPICGPTDSAKLVTVRLKYIRLVKPNLNKKFKTEMYIHEKNHTTKIQRLHLRTCASWLTVTTEEIQRMRKALHVKNRP